MSEQVTAYEGSFYRAPSKVDAQDTQGSTPNPYRRGNPRWAPTPVEPAWPERIVPVWPIPIPRPGKSPVVVPVPIRRSTRPAREPSRVPSRRHSR